MARLTHSRHRILRGGELVIDLGCAPGGWSVYASELLKPQLGGVCLGVDLLPMDPVPNVDFIQGNFLDPVVQNQIREVSLNRKADVILSDMLHNLTGHRSTDQSRSMNICFSVLDFAKSISAAKGTLLMKFLRCEEDKELMEEISASYESTKVLKPKASRGESSEAYILAKNFRGS